MPVDIVWDRGATSTSDVRYGQCLGAPHASAQPSAAIASATRPPVSTRHSLPSWGRGGSRSCSARCLRSGALGLWHSMRSLLQPSSWRSKEGASGRPHESDRAPPPPAAEQLRDLQQRPKRASATGGDRSTVESSTGSAGRRGAVILIGSRSRCRRSLQFRRRCKIPRCSPWSLHVALNAEHRHRVRDHLERPRRQRSKCRCELRAAVGRGRC